MGSRMGKVLVLYHSATGNTAAMARLTAEGAGLNPGTEVAYAHKGAHWRADLGVTARREGPLASMPREITGGSW